MSGSDFGLPTGQPQPEKPSILRKVLGKLGRKVSPETADSVIQKAKNELESISREQQRTDARFYRKFIFKDPNAPHTHRYQHKSNAPLENGRYGLVSFSNYMGKQKGALLDVRRRVTSLPPSPAKLELDRKIEQLERHNVALEKRIASTTYLQALKRHDDTLREAVKIVEGGGLPDFKATALRELLRSSDLCREVGERWERNPSLYSKEGDEAVKDDAKKIDRETVLCILNAIRQCKNECDKLMRPNWLESLLYSSSQKANIEHNRKQLHTSIDKAALQVEQLFDTFPKIANIRPVELRPATRQDSLLNWNVTSIAARVKSIGTTLLKEQGRMPLQSPSTSSEKAREALREQEERLHTLEGMLAAETEKLQARGLSTKKKETLGTIALWQSQISQMRQDLEQVKSQLSQPQSPASVVPQVAAAHEDQTAAFDHNYSTFCQVVDFFREKDEPIKNPLLRTVTRGLKPFDDKKEDLRANQLVEAVHALQRMRDIRNLAPPGERAAMQVAAMNRKINEATKVLEVLFADTSFMQLSEDKQKVLGELQGGDVFVDPENPRRIGIVIKSLMAQAMFTPDHDAKKAALNTLWAIDQALRDNPSILKAVYSRLSEQPDDLVTQEFSRRISTNFLDQANVHLAEVEKKIEEVKEQFRSKADPKLALQLTMQIKGHYRNAQKLLQQRPYDIAVGNRVEKIQELLESSGVTKFTPLGDQLGVLHSILVENTSAGDQLAPNERQDVDALLAGIDEGLLQALLAGPVPNPLLSNIQAYFLEHPKTSSSLHEINTALRTIEEESKKTSFDYRVYATQSAIVANATRGLKQQTQNSWMEEYVNVITKRAEEEMASVKASMKNSLVEQLEREEPFSTAVREVELCLQEIALIKDSQNIMRTYRQALGKLTACQKELDRLNTDLTIADLLITDLGLPTPDAVLASATDKVLLLNAAQLEQVQMRVTDPSMQNQAQFWQEMQPFIELGEDVVRQVFMRILGVGQDKGARTLLLKAFIDALPDPDAKRSYHRLRVEAMTPFQSMDVYGCKFQLKETFREIVKYHFFLKKVAEFMQKLPSDAQGNQDVTLLQAPIHVLAEHLIDSFLKAFSEPTRGRLKEILQSLITDPALLTVGSPQATQAFDELFLKECNATLMLQNVSMNDFTRFTSFMLQTCQALIKMPGIFATCSEESLTAFRSLLDPTAYNPQLTSESLANDTAQKALAIVAQFSTRLGIALGRFLEKYPISEERKIASSMYLTNLDTSEAINRTLADYWSRR